MILSFIIFLVLFIGGMWVMGISHDIVGFEALLFCAGLALFCLSMAWIMRADRGGATRRSNNWDGGPATN
ncbi:hypothetical protein HD600_000386 [Microbacterium ginsengiterrae]|uniref:Uncharacterized protein n=1 Tax=Microbacterium ginsengiterrae TaxID=546115 RepID=A0A7W9CA65_9MICO|nr:MULTISPECIES: hypothetical protein [Microbacterium]MBB5741889.1 hypothetical protein [Microbacterium ginsengiterrae]